MRVLKRLETESSASEKGHSRGITIRAKGEAAKRVTDRNFVSDCTLLGLKILPWLSTTYRLKSDVLSMTYKAVRDLGLTPTFCFFCGYSYLGLCANKALAFTSHPCQLPSAASLQRIPLRFRALSLGHIFSSACQALLILPCHHPSWPSLAQHFLLQDASLFRWSAPDTP